LLVEQFLENSARTGCGKIALIDRRRRLTYGEIDRQSNRVARALIAGGAKRGDRIAISMENSAEAVISIFAALKAGGVFVLVNPGARQQLLAEILHDCGAAALLTDGAKPRSVSPSLRIFAQLGEIADNPALDDGPLPKQSIDLDLAALIYTSGSTGRPKGVMLTHQNMVAAATTIAGFLKNTADDVILTVLPLSHGYGLYQILTAFKVGASVVLERGFTYPAATLRRMQDEKATGFPLIPTMSSILSRMNLAEWDLSSLRYITNAGDAFPLHHISNLRQVLPHVELYSMYGLTECQRVSYLPPDQIDLRPASVGRGLLNEELEIVDEDGVGVAPSVVGELVVRAAHVMKGYWQMPHETDSVLKPGRFPWEKILYTGDLFWRDKEGYLYFAGRKDHVIKTRGEKVYPREIENVLLSLPGIAEAAVIGVPDETLGQMIKAIVVPREGIVLTDQDVLRHCASHLEEFKVPGSVEFSERLPRTTNGKIAKRKLANAAEAA
jgi:long-chain acyl-CoA synthetase